MSQFDDREKAFERKFVFDAELDFKANARRNKLLGLWAAEIMGMDDDMAQVYARDVVRSDLEEAGEEDVYRKVMGDFAAKGLEMSEHRLRRNMAELMDEAHRQIQANSAK